MSLHPPPLSGYRNRYRNPTETVPVRDAVARNTPLSTRRMCFRAGGRGDTTRGARHARGRRRQRRCDEHAVLPVQSRLVRHPGSAGKAWHWSKRRAVTRSIM